MQDKVPRYGQFEVGFATVPSKTDEVGAPKVLRVPQEGNLKTDVSPMKLLRTVAYGLHKCRGKMKGGPLHRCLNQKRQGLHIGVAYLLW